MRFLDVMRVIIMLVFRVRRLLVLSVVRGLLVLRVVLGLLVLGVVPVDRVAISSTVTMVFVLVNNAAILRYMFISLNYAMLIPVLHVVCFTVVNALMDNSSVRHILHILVMSRCVIRVSLASCFRIIMSVIVVMHHMERGMLVVEVTAFMARIDPVIGTLWHNFFVIDVVTVFSGVEVWVISRNRMRLVAVTLRV